jgi:hypothetical protein
VSAGAAKRHTFGRYIIVNPGRAKRYTFRTYSTDEAELRFIKPILEGRDREELIQKLRLVDRPELAKRLREGGPLFKYERDFLADLVEGKKSPRHRPPSVDTALRNDIMAEWYLHLQAHHPGLQKRQIERAIATTFGKTSKWVRDAVRSLSPARRKEIESEVAKGLAERTAAALEAK